MIKRFESFNELDPYGEEDWNDDNSKKTLINPCQHCHNEEGIYRPNPYILEIEGDYLWEYICERCHRALCMDI